MQVPAYTVHGTNDDHDTCSHCGKSGLKRVVWLSYNDVEGNSMGNPEPVGTSCAARLMKKTITNVTRLAEAADRERINREMTTIHEVGEIRSACTWVIESVGQNGGSVTRLGLANGLRQAVELWAENRWANLITNIRPAR